MSTPAADLPDRETSTAETASTARTGGNRSELIVSAVLAVIGAYALIDAITMSGSFSRVDPIGPRAFPFIVAGGLFLTAILLVVNVLRGGSGEAEGGEDVDLSAPADWRTVLLLLGVFAANIALVNLLGWVISGGLLFFGTAWVLGSRHPIRDLIISAVLSLVTFYGFYVGLGIHLPAGILQGIL
jgi:putative tricarboxylic transport membrane protein